MRRYTPFIEIGLKQLSKGLLEIILKALVKSFKEHKTSSHAFTSSMQNQTLSKFLKILPHIPILTLRLDMEQ